MTTAQYALVAVTFLAGAAGWYSWRRLWRPLTGPWSRLVYGAGVRGLGLLMWIAFGAGYPVAQYLFGRFRGEPRIFLAVLIADLVIGFPLSLWVGYWWGRSVARRRGLSPDDDRP